MSYLTTKKILDRVSARIEDNSPDLRNKLLGWLNQVMQDVAVAKVNSPWEFLIKTKSDLAVSNNMIAKPTDLDRVVNIAGDGWFLEAKHQLSDEEACRYANDNATSPEPMGFTISGTAIALWPGASGTADLKYVCEVPEYADDAASTLFPVQMINVFVYGVLNQYYEYDADPQFANAPTLYQYHLSRARRWDNAKKPMPRMNRHGYLRRA